MSFFKRFFNFDQSKDVEMVYDVHKLFVKHRNSIKQKYDKSLDLELDDDHYQIWLMSDSVTFYLNDKQIAFVCDHQELINLFRKMKGISVQYSYDDTVSLIEKKLSE